MLRLISGLVLGLLLGGLVGAVVMFGFGQPTFGPETLFALEAYGLSALTGALVGLVAGKPIWAKGARIEASLKAVFGVLLAAGLTYVFRAWAPIHAPAALGLPFTDPIGSVPILLYPALGVVLATVFEVDNLFGDSSDSSDKSPPKRLASSSDGDKSKVRVQAEEDELDQDEEPAPRNRTKR